MGGYKKVNSNFIINFKNKTICIPSLMFNKDITIVDLLTLMYKNKQILNNEVYKRKDNFCVLLVLDVDFKCSAFTSCEECIFKPNNIKTIGLSNLKKFLSLSIYKEYWKNRKNRVLNIIKK